MKKIFLIFSITCVAIFAHDEYFLNIIDNKNNTITIIGDDDHKEGIEGALIRIESLFDGKILYQERLPKESKVVVAIPKEPYQVVLDAGNGNILIKDGIAPKEGFLMKQNTESKNKKITRIQDGVDSKWDFLTISFFSLCLVAFLLAIYFSNRNTNLILEKIKLNK